MSPDGNTYMTLECPRCGAPLTLAGDELTCAYCRARLVRRVPAQAGAAARAPVPTTRLPAVSAGGLRLAPYSYYDPQSGMEVFNILVPEGWRVNGGIEWVTSRPAAPVNIRLQLANPHGLEAFEAHPSLYFTWSNNPLTAMTKPPGSLHFGFEVRQPLSARDGMHRYALPRYRAVPGLAVVDEGPAPELLQVARHFQSASQPGAQVSADAVRMRLHYTLNQQPVAEEISCVAEYTRLFATGLFGSAETVIWNLGFMTSFRASRESLEGYADLYRAIFSSISYNPAWTALLQQVIQGLSRNTIQHIQQIGALGRQISQNASQMREENLAGWQQRSAARDQVAEKFSQVIRGVETYHDPNSGQTVELPGGYQQAWSTPLGEFVLSEDPNFNPNIGSNQTWTPMPPVDPLHP